MASTRQEAEVIERKLRPVYDALDNSQYKKVIQMVEKILKKSPHLHCAKALKAVAMLRLGKAEEGNKMINEVISARPGDNATLQAVFMCCRELGDYKKIVELYEAAVKSYPTNEEFLTQLFMAYVRVGDYQKQQQIAVQLAKQYPQNGPYYCWRIMSVLMQAHEADPTIAQQMYLPLAEKLMEKYISEKRVEAEAEVRLYIVVLQSLNKDEKILSVLRGELGEKLRHPEEVLLHELTCMSSLEQWDELAVKLPPLISAQPDQWSYLKLYVISQLQRVKKRGHFDGKENAPVTEGKETVHKSEVVSPIDEMSVLLDELLSQELEKSSRHLRGPLLVKLEVFQQMKDLDISSDHSSFSNPFNLLEQFFKLFSSKSCCYSDVSPYLSLLSKEQKDELLAKLSAWCDNQPVDFNCQENEISANVSRLYRDITLLKLQRHCGAHDSLSLDDKRQLVVMCYKTFEAGLCFGLSLAATVNQHSDFYIILAAHLMMEIYEETGNYGDLWDCVIMLEAARPQSPSNPQILLLLMKLYGILGAIDQCTQLYKKLAIKHVQVDTLGYMVHRRIQAAGAFGYASQLFRLSLRFYLGCKKETSDYITNSYKNGVFHKIIEIVELKERISRSYEFYSLGVESLIQEFMKNSNSMEQARGFLLGEKYTESLPYTVEDLEVLFAGLRDNRDIEVLEDWSPPEKRCTSEEIELSFQLECLWIKFRLATMQTLKSVVGVVDTPTREAALAQLNQLSILLEQIGQHNGLLFLRQKASLHLPLQSPPPCQLNMLFNGRYSALLSCAVSVSEKVLSSTPESCPSLVDDISTARDILREICAKVNGISQEDAPGDVTSTTTYQSLLKTKIDLEPYVLLIIISSWIVVFCAVSLEQLSPGRKTTKKKKKSQQPSVTPAKSETQSMNIMLILDLLKDMKSSLLSLSSKFTCLSLESTLTERLKQLYLSDPAPSDTPTGIPNELYCQVKAKVIAEVVESYNICFRECHEMIGYRVSFLNSLLASYSNSCNERPAPLLDGTIPPPS